MEVIRFSVNKHNFYRNQLFTGQNYLYTYSGVEAVANNYDELWSLEKATGAIGMVSAYCNCGLKLKKPPLKVEKSKGARFGALQKRNYKQTCTLNVKEKSGT